MKIQSEIRQKKARPFQAAAQTPARAAQVPVDRGRMAAIDRDTDTENDHRQRFPTTGSPPVALWVRCPVRRLQAPRP